MHNTPHTHTTQPVNFPGRCSLATNIHTRPTPNFPGRPMTHDHTHCKYLHEWKITYKCIYIHTNISIYIYIYIRQLADLHLMQWHLYAYTTYTHSSHTYMQTITSHIHHYHTYITYHIEYHKPFAASPSLVYRDHTDCRRCSNHHIVVRRAGITYWSPTLQSPSLLAATAATVAVDVVVACIAVDTGLNFALIRNRHSQA